ncbi:hypothetical protein IWW38_006481, partial [Coemansia aciculifera]
MTAANAAAAATRLRKVSELSALRPRSVEPHGAADGDSGTGSALPATASWATRAMASKKSVNEPLEPKARRPESGGTMTLRMIPASRNKAAATASSTTAKPIATTTPAPVAVASASNTSPTTPAALATSARERAKTATATTTSPTTATPDATLESTSAAGIPHHPTLQQLSRERKQQQRQQTRAQQRQAKQTDADDVDGDGDTETDVDVDAESSKKRKLASKVAASKAAAASTKDGFTPADKHAQLQSDGEQMTTAVAQEAHVVVATSEPLDLDNEVASVPETGTVPVPPQTEAVSETAVPETLVASQDEIQESSA